MSQRHSSSISWFTIIGALAALTHYLTAVGIEHTNLLSAGQANITGFMVAFPVSYFGHRQFSFTDQTLSHCKSFPRFFSVAILGFIANQTLVLNALHYIRAPFWLILGMVMVLVAVSTYLLSKYWAFKGSQ